MRNMRRKHDHDIPVVQEKRLKLQGRKENDGKKDIPAYGAARYLSTRPIAEDDSSIEGHISTMKKISKSANKDSRQIAASMEATYADRRNFLVHTHPTLGCLKEKFPLLFDSYQILYEFERLTLINIATIFETQLQKYENSLVAILCTPTAKGSKNCSVVNQTAILDHSKQDQLITTSEAEETEESVEDPEHVTIKALLRICELLEEKIFIQAALMLCYHSIEPWLFILLYCIVSAVNELETDPDFSCLQGSEQSMKLYLHGDPLDTNVKGTITAEDIIVCNTEGFIQAVEVFFAAHWVLNLSYCSHSKKSLQFMQKILLGIPISGKYSPAISTLYKKIMKNMTSADTTVKN